MYGYTYIKGMDQPDKVANPARGQLNRENEYFPVPVFAAEKLAPRSGFGSLVPRQPPHLHTRAESGAHLRDFSRIPRRRPFIYLNRQEAKAGLRHAFVCPNVIGRTKKRIVQSKRTRAGSLALVD